MAADDSGEAPFRLFVSPAPFARWRRPTLPDDSRLPAARLAAAPLSPEPLDRLTASLRLLPPPDGSCACRVPPLPPDHVESLWLAARLAGTALSCRLKPPRELPDGPDAPDGPSDCRRDCGGACRSTCRFVAGGGTSRLDPRDAWLSPPDRLASFGGLAHATAATRAVMTTPPRPIPHRRCQVRSFITGSLRK